MSSRARRAADKTRPLLPLPTPHSPPPQTIVLEKKHRTLSSICLLNDAVASNLAMLCAWFLRVSLKSIPVTEGPQEVEPYLQPLPFVTIAFPLTFAVPGLSRIRPTRSKREERLSAAV